MTLIAFLSVGMGLALGRGNVATRLKSSESSLASYLQLVRSRAILDGQPARVLFAADTSVAETYYRRVGGVVRDADNANQWIALDDGFELSEGIYLWPDQSRLDLSAMQLEYPVRQPVTAGSGETWLYLEFDALGELVVNAGGLTLVSTQPEAGSLPQPDLDDIYGGFLLSKLGVVVFPQNPEDLRP
jgi:hypothetical protein